MKNILGILMLLFVFNASAQETKSKVGIIEIKTSAVCEQCKERIEEKLNYTKGIIFAELDLETKILTVKFRRKTIKPDAIRTIIADIGYHADDVERNKAAFSKLPKCCRDKNASCTKE